MRVITLEGPENVRDVGGTPLLNGRQVKPGLIYRGSDLARLTDADKTLLFSTLGIQIIIDLRCGWEREDKPTPHIAGVRNYVVPFYDEAIVGIDYHEPSQAPYATTEVVGRDVACNPTNFYSSCANPLTVGQMRQGLNILFGAVARGIPIYQHCSGGKDRTGLMTFLALHILGADPEAILEDYLYTNVSRDAHDDEMFARFLKLAQGDAVLARKITDEHRARSENLEAFTQAIEATYGSLDEFITRELNFNEDRRTSLQRLCTTEA